MEKKPVSNAYHSELRGASKKHALGETALARQRSFYKRMEDFTAPAVLALTLIFLIGAMAWTLSAMASPDGLSDFEAELGRVHQSIHHGLKGILLALLALGPLWALSERNAPLLQPLNEREDDSCARAVRLASASPSAARWRDEAVAAGRQLRGFDLEAMERLRALEKQGLLIEQRKAMCAKAHGAAS